MYLYDQHALRIARELRPAARKELEITVSISDLRQGGPERRKFGRGTSLTRYGKHSSLLQASVLETIECARAEDRLPKKCLSDVVHRSRSAADGSEFRCGR